MISRLNPALGAEISQNTAHLPAWPEDPTQCDYTNAQTAYAVNVTLLHGDFEWHPATGTHLPTRQTKALLVQRASGDGQIGSESGVSGYVATRRDPQGKVKPEYIDPIAYTARAELHEECGIPWEAISTIGLHLGSVITAHINLALGQRFTEPRFGQGGVLRKNCVVHVLPMLGLCLGDNRPQIAPDPKEVSGYAWVPLGEVSRRNLSSGYLKFTLPNALGALGLTNETVDKLILPNNPTARTNLQ